MDYWYLLLAFLIVSGCLRNAHRIIKSLRADNFKLIDALQNSYSDGSSELNHYREFVRSIYIYAGSYPSWKAQEEYRSDPENELIDQYLGRVVDSFDKLILTLGENKIGVSSWSSGIKLSERRGDWILEKDSALDLSRKEVIDSDVDEYLAENPINLLEEIESPSLNFAVFEMEITLKEDEQDIAERVYFKYSGSEAGLEAWLKCAKHDDEYGRQILNVSLGDGTGSFIELNAWRDWQVGYKFNCNGFSPIDESK